MCIRDSIRTLASLQGKLLALFPAKDGACDLRRQLKAHGDIMSLMEEFAWRTMPIDVNGWEGDPQEAEFFFDMYWHGYDRNPGMLRFLIGDDATTSP